MIKQAIGAAARVSINRGNLPGLGGGGMIRSALASAGVGALGGAVMADDNRRMRGAIGGGLAGLAGGAAISRYARTGSRTSWRAASKVSSKAVELAMHPRTPWGDGVYGFNQRVHSAVAGFHNKANRSAIMRSGALLGGGAFGLMFAGSGKSHRRGFNANRGNGIRR